MHARFASLKKRCLHTVLVLTLLMIFGIGANQTGAQQAVGSLSGKVTSGGAGINNIRIDVYTLNWSFVKSAWTTDSSGNYTVGGLPAGNYYLATYNQQGYIDEYYVNIPKAGSAWPPVGVTSVGVVIGSNTPNINFGLLVGGSISGRVVKDLDNTTGIQNVEIDVYDSNWNFVNSILTDSSGYYTIGGLPGGTGGSTASYYVGTWNQQGYVDEYYNNIRKAGTIWPPSGAAAVSVTTGSSTPNINFGLSGGGSISGQVVSGGVGIQGVEIDIYDSNWKRLNSTMTNATGNYKVQGLPVGNYYLGTLNQQGYIDEYYGDIIKATSTWPPAGAAAVSVDGVSETQNINFGLAWGGSISGQVVSGGVGIQGVEIDVYGSNWSRVTSAVTNASGNYTVGGLPTGSYYLKTLNYHGYIDEYYVNATTSGGATPVGVTTGLNTAGINFGLAQSGSMSGTVVRSSDHAGIQGIQISVYSSGWNPVQQATTDSSGRYVIGGLAGGSYYVETWNQQGYIDQYYNNATSSAGASLVSVTAGSNMPNINFTLVLSGSISGRVSRNTDGSGIQNVTIDVYNSGWIYAANVGTDASGNYTMGGLVGGSYYVKTYNDQGYLDEYYNNVLVMGNSWPPAGATAVSVTGGSTTSNINFGLAQGGSISGRVTRNLNGAGIQNIQVKAYDTNWNPIKTSATNASGNYTIKALTAGNYYLVTANDQGYMNEYYNNALSQSTATAASVTLGADTPNINFTLSALTSGSISGQVVKNPGGTWIQNVEIDVYDSNWNLLSSSTRTDSSGNYTAVDLPAGSYYLGTSNQQGYNDEYYNNVLKAGSPWPPVGASAVSVAMSSNTPNINFGLSSNGPGVSVITPNSGITGTVVNITNLAGTGFLAGATVKLSRSGSTDINASSVVVVSSTQITCTLTLAGAGSGQWNVVVTNPNNQFGMLNNGFTVNLNPPPTVTGITPNSGAAGAPVNITSLAGTGFLAGATVKLSRSGSADINASSVMVVSPTQITCTFDLTNATSGQWNVVVTNTDNQSGTLNNGFTVTNPPPKVTGITPNSGVTGAPVNITNLAGTGFLAGATIKLSRSGSADINGASVLVVSSTQITCTFDLTSAANGQWNLVLTNGDGQSVTVNNAFTVTNPPPKVSSITPNSGAAGAPVNITNLAGTGFLAGATVKLSRIGSADINATSVVVVSSTQITCAFDLTGAASGQWNVVVTNTDNQSGPLNNGFAVTIPPPTVSSIAPNSGVTGAPVNSTNLAGTGFLAGATVKLTRSGRSDINATSVVVVSPTQITCTFNLTGAIVGSWNVVVTNTDSQSGILSSGFSVTNPPPTVTGIAPNSGVTGATVTVTNLAGTGFVAGATVKLTRSGSADINATSVVVAAWGQISCVFNLAGAAASAWDVVVTNTDGQSGTLSGGFTVANPAPAVSGITPSSAAAGVVVNITSLAGTGFLTGATVKLTRSGSPDINASSVVVVSPTQITCTCDLTGAGVGPWNVVVTNTDSQSGTKNRGFTVTNPPPTMSGIAPNSAVIGSTANVTNLAGTGFLAGATVKLTRSGSADINATSVVIVSSTQITCTFNLTGAGVGPWNVIVTNTDGQSGPLNNGFAVTNPPPTVTGITPNSGAAGAAVNITNLSGAGFLAGATVKLTRSGGGDINATSVVIGSSTQITCTFNLTGAAAGPCNVVVTNADSQSGTLDNGFTVTNPPPTVSGITANSGATGSTVNIANLAGTGFLPGATVKLTRTGGTGFGKPASAAISATSASVVSPTQITCTFNLTGAAMGLWNVVVTNADGQLGTLNNGFTVNNPMPAVNSIAPNSGVMGAAVNITNLAGTGFLGGATVKLIRSGAADINATSVLIVSSTQITCAFNLANAALGPWSVVVTNTDGQSGILTNGFTVTMPSPTVGGITPNSGVTGVAVNITNLAGTGFLGGATVKLTRSGAADINATSVLIVSSTQITCAFNLANAALGPWNVVVTNTDGQSATLNSGFTVANPAPSVSGITPNFGVTGTTVNITNLGGTGFLAGAAVKLTRSGRADVNATSVVVVSSTQIMCTFNLTGAIVGAWNIVVTNTDGQFGSLSGFAVTNPAPTVSGITPNSGVTGTTVTVTNLAGTGFLAGATVKLTRNGSVDINATSVAVASWGRITCIFNLAGAAAGPWDVVVTNTDGQSGTLSGGFTIGNPAPRVSSLTPSSGFAGTTVNITDLAGTGFLGGATVKLTLSGSPDINGTSVMVVSPTQIACTFDLTGAAVGPWNVVVTNTDGQSGTLNRSFAITNPAPR